MPALVALRAIFGTGPVTPSPDQHESPLRLKLPSHYPLSLRSVFSPWRQHPPRFPDPARPDATARSHASARMAPLPIRAGWCECHPGLAAAYCPAPREYVPMPNLVPRFYTARRGLSPTGNGS